MKDKIRRFFSGRNGFDALSNTILWTAIILMVIRLFVSSEYVGFALSTISWAGVIYAYWRMLSRNLPKRQAENWTFLSWKNQLRQRWQQRKTHKFYRCPKCRTMLRVPKGKGKINITCKNCGEKFIRKT